MSSKIGEMLANALVIGVIVILVALIVWIISIPFAIIGVILIEAVDIFIAGDIEYGWWGASVVGLAVAIITALIARE